MPVVDFWSTETSIAFVELRDAVDGRSERYPRGVAVTDEDQRAVLEALDIEIGNWISHGAIEDVEHEVGEGALGIVRASQVGPRLRALAIDGVSLFGVDRVMDIGHWPLRAEVRADEPWDQQRAWTWVAAGDVMMDRGVALAVRQHDDDGDYLFNGGTARVAGIRCCSVYGFRYPQTDHTGNAGAVRDLLSSAEVASANLESAILVNAPWHEHGLTFTADAALLDAVDRAGLDFMSLGNNHVRNAGARGIETAIAELDERGIAHSGAGLADEAGAPGYVDVNGIRIAIVSCDAVVPGWAARPGRVGTFNCRDGDVAGRIREIAPTADVIAVYPHWGREYHPEPLPYQRRLAAEWIEAGADLVIGAHSHVAGAMEQIDGGLVFYSLGNFIFDQDFRTETMMGVVPELAFYGARLVQVRLHATLIIDAQPNLVSAADGGELVFDQMREASRGLFV